jgi:hypothetical protein
MIKKLVFVVGAVAVAGYLIHGAIKKTAARVFPHDGEWFEVETQDDPRERPAFNSADEFGAAEGLAFLQFGGRDRR